MGEMDPSALDVATEQAALHTDELFALRATGVAGKQGKALNGLSILGQRKVIELSRDSTTHASCVLGLLMIEKEEESVANEGEEFSTKRIQLCIKATEGAMITAVAAVAAVKKQRRIVDGLRGVCGEGTEQKDTSGWAETEQKCKTAITVAIKVIEDYQREKKKQQRRVRDARRKKQKQDELEDFLLRIERTVGRVERAVSLLGGGETSSVADQHNATEEDMLSFLKRRLDTLDESVATLEKRSRQ